MRLRLLQFREFVGIVEDDKELSLPHGLIGVDENANDAFGNLARDFDGVCIDVRVVGSLMRERILQPRDSED